jgi:OOP family OmpA-OmpF porin
LAAQRVLDRKRTLPECPEGDRRLRRRNPMKCSTLIVLFVSLLLSPSYSAQAQAPLAPPDTGSIKAYSKFDFVPGEKVVAIEDFMQDSIGDFPAKWNTNAAAEIVTIEGKPGRWLKFTQAGVFVPELLSLLPDNFTLEFDLLAGNPFTGSQNFALSIVELENPKAPATWQMADNRFTLMTNPNDGYGNGASSMEPRQNGVGVAAVSAETKQFNFKNSNPVHVSIWRQKQRVRVYFNQEKAWDVPRALVEGVKYNAVVFYLAYVASEYQYYLGNLRIAVGAPDTRNKLLTEGKWVTHGILFDVNSDKIKGESYGTLKEIANVLKESTDIKLPLQNLTQRVDSYPYANHLLQTHRL